MVKLVKHDLQFILNQIKVAEAHSAGTPLTDLVDHQLIPYGLRTVDGSFNNLAPGQEEFGSADEFMQRLLTPRFNPAEGRPAGLHSPSTPAGPQTTYEQTSGNVYDSQPRIISNLIVDQTIGNPATIISALINLGEEDPYGFLASHQAVYDAAVAAYDAAVAANSAVGAAKAALAALSYGPPPSPAAVTAAQAIVTTAQSALDAALADKAVKYGAMEDAMGVSFQGDSVFIPNVSADLGDTAPFNGFLTLFGQFFDHGLDLVAKGGSGTVYVPLQPDDPLYVEGSPTNFMVLTRAQNESGADGVVGTADDVHEHRNETTAWIDLNQVYTSNPSHQVFLREYAMVDGKPMATGAMLEGANGGPPTWADVKEQARTMLGIELTDADILRVPAVLTDLYGEFIRGSNGLPQIVTSAGAVEGNLATPVAASAAVSAGRAFLNDIAHTAAPSGPVDHDRNPATAPVAVTADADDVAGNAIVPNMYGISTTYDDELLDAHFIVGDGRGNENIGLTSVHHVFHHEHNRQVEEIKSELLTGPGADVGFLNEWLLVDVTALPATQAEIDALVWDGERLFQAGRFSTEMVYQHLVFEEFARAVSPNTDAFLFSNTVDLDPGIAAEFAHVVYRFGHSMLTEDVARLDLILGGNSEVTAQQADDIALMDAFLNPIAFAASGVDSEAAAGAILRGMSRQAGSEIDEHVTDALRNNLVGLPLDLATLNLTRARETGVPSLNAARRDFYEQTQDSMLRPYESWYDFALSMKNPASLINFIAAYGTHETILDAEGVDAKRAAASLIVLGGTGAPGDRLAFLNGTGAWSSNANGVTTTGLDNVDFWIGGLAEKKMPFGGMLGSTFNFVFEVQMEKLQDGDRFYYLSRTQGLNLLNELEADSFAQLVMRNTDTGEHDVAINGAAFQTADYILEMDQAKQFNPGLGAVDPTGTNPILAAINPLVIRQDVDGDGDIDLIRYTGGEHVVIGGTAEADVIIGGEGDDTLWGGDGNDRLEGGFGVDHLHGGEGDDIITDAGTDIGAADVIHGDEGDDVINAGNGLDLIFGGAGSDFLYGGTEDKTISGGRGNDFIRGSDGLSFLAGNEGDDWIEGGDRFDTLAGENSELFFNSTIIGHDVLNGRGNDTDYDGESGDDIMFQGPGIQRNNGMAGFDWAIHKGDTQAADSDMNVSIFTNQQSNILRDRFDLVEGISGWKLNDKLTGRDVVVGGYDADGNAAEIDPNSPFDSYSNALLEKNVDLIAGLRELTNHIERTTVTAAGVTETIVMDTSDASDIMLGGGGSDLIEGKGGNDIIDGDQWLNVRILVTPDASRGQTFTAFSIDTLDEIQQRMFSGEIKGSQLSIVREILDGAQAGDVDTAVFWDAFENYAFTSNSDGSITVEHVDPTVGAIDPTTGKNRESDGIDRLYNIERLRFADGDVMLTAPELKLHAFENGEYRDTFGSSNYGNSNGDTPWGPDWIETGDDGSASNQSGQIRITNGGLRFEDGNGATITRAVNLSSATSATLSFSANPDNLDDGEFVSVLFSADGVNFVELGTITGNNSSNPNYDLTGPFTVNSAIRFVVTSINNTNELVSIDNVTIDFSMAAPDASVNHETTFVEDDDEVTIADLPGIVDDGGEIVSARIVLTNAQANDRLFLDGNLNGTGITSAVDISVAGQITLTLTGDASLAAYQAAIQAVRFENTSDTPSTQDRIINVTVNNGLMDSNVAVATVNVVAENDQVNANNDSVYTNITSGSIVIPEWALLANDTDADSTLDITGTSGANGVSTPSLSTNPGSVTFTDTGGAGGSFNYTASDGLDTDQASVSLTRDTTGTIEGSGSNNILVGDGAGSTFDGGGGNDVILAGGGNDIIVWNNGDGRDVVNGGAGTLDSFVVNGSNQSEAFIVYARSAAIAAGIAGLHAQTEIVITRNGTVIAELDDVEEITINTGPGTDSVQAMGDFSPTSLSFNTITINGDSGDDTVDISSLQSAHRIVFRSNGGNDRIIGNLRPQDVVVLAAGLTLGDYVSTVEAGETTLTSDDSVITFKGTPQVKTADAEIDDEIEDDDDDAPDPVGSDDDDDQDDDQDDGDDAGETPDPVSAPNVGTTGADVLVGTSGRDDMIAHAGDDVIIGGGDVDNILGGDGADFINAGDGRDIVFGGAGDDTIFGGADADMIYGDAGDDRIFGDAGDDLINAGAGGDTVVGGAGNDRFVAEIGDGNDSYFGDEPNGGLGVDTLDLSVLTSAATVDLGTGVGGHGSVASSQSGTDALWGVENVIGGSGADSITASEAVNVLDGGAGNDTFRFLSTDAADGDTIVNFQVGDQIDLTGIDASTGVAGNQAFSLVSGSSFTAAAQLMVSYEAREDGDYTVVQGNIGGDAAADFRLSLKGTHDLAADDFKL